MKKTICTPIVLVFPLLFWACALQGGLSALPGGLDQIEQVKSEIVTAPLAGCISVIQQTNTLMNSLKSGSPPVVVGP